MLVFMLIILAIMLVIAVTIAAMSSRERKLLIENRKSIQAFQAAEIGAEFVMKMIKEANASSQLQVVFGTNCNAGKVTGGVAGGSYTVTFLDENNQELGCAASVSAVRSCKSVGNYAGTFRAIQVAVGS